MAPRKKAAPKPKAKPVPKLRAVNKADKIPKRRLTPEPEPEIPPWDRSVRSQSKRRNTGFKMTRASLYDESINERSINKLFEQLDPESLSRTTWGVPVAAGVKAPKVRKQETMTIHRRMAKRFTGTDEQKYSQMMRDIGGQVREAIPNDPRRTPLLRLSCEVRERIYEHLLVTKNKPILIKPDWQTVETIVMGNSIRRTCKQLFEEGTAYLFKNNTIQAIFRKTSRHYIYWNDPIMIPKYYISYYRNIVLDFNSDCWGIDWYEKATESLRVLFEARATISSLTLILNPQRVGMSNTALGMESNPITFADFLWHGGNFMTFLRLLAPTKLNIVIKKGPTKRLTVCLDLRHLAACEKQSAELLNVETEEILFEREEAVVEGLRGLKDRFEEIFEDDMRATRVGKCTSNEPLPPEPIEEVMGEVTQAMADHMLILKASVDIEAIEKEVLFEDDPIAICTDIDGSEHGSDEEDDEHVGGANNLET